jgi:WD40 repeat protein
MFRIPAGRGCGGVWLAAAVLAASTAWGSTIISRPLWTLQLRQGESLETFSPDWKSVATVESLTGDRSLIRLWEVGTSRLRRVLRVPGNEEDALVFRVLVSPDGKTLASETETQRDTLQVRLWDVQTGRLKRTLALPEGTGMTGDCVTLAFSPDSKTLATISVAEVRDGEQSVVRLWDLQTGTAKRRLSGAGNLAFVVFSCDGRLLAGVSKVDDDLTVKLWDLRTGKVTQTLAGHGVAVSRIVFSPDGKLLAGVSDNDTLRLWDLQTGRLVRTLSESSGRVAFSPDGKSLIAVGEATGVRIWDVPAGRLKRTLEVDGALFLDAVSPDATTVATVGEHVVKLWRIR